MTIKSFSQLKCTNCESQLTPKKIFLKDKTEIICGSASCQCEEYPIVEGILIFDKRIAKYHLKLIEKGHYITSLVNLCTESKKKQIIVRAVLFFHSFISKIYTNLTISSLLIRVLSPLLLDSYMKFRKNEIDQFFYKLPLLFLTADNKGLTWINLGSGAVTFYRSSLRVFPKINFLSVDHNFFCLLFSKIADNTPNAQYVLASLEDGYPFTCKADVITSFDVLPFIVNQKKLLSQIFNMKLVTDSAIIFISSLPEHFYFSEEINYIFPMSRNLTHNFIPTSFRTNVKFIDDLQLTHAFKGEIKNLKDICINKNDSLSGTRYSILWSKKKMDVKLNKNFQLSAKNNLSYWNPQKPTWENTVY